MVSIMPISDEQAQKCLVYFVGNAMNFSTSMLRAAEFEIPEIGFHRVASLAEVEDLPAGVASNVLAIILDETFFAEFSNSASGLRAAFPNTLFAVAYRSPDIVRTQLTDRLRDLPLDSISFLPMNIQFDSWLSILRLILGGDGYISRELLMPVVDMPTGQTMHPALVPPRPVEVMPNGNLTEREVEVLSHVAEGKQNKVIAHELGLSEHTVKLHIHHVIAKLGVCNRTEAAAWYFEHRNLLSSSFRK